MTRTHIVANRLFGLVRRCFDEPSTEMWTATFHDPAQRRHVRNTAVVTARPPSPNRSSAPRNRSPAPTPPRTPPPAPGPSPPHPRVVADGRAPAGVDSRRTAGPTGSRPRGRGGAPAQAAGRAGRAEAGAARGPDGASGADSARAGRRERAGRWPERAPRAPSGAAHESAGRGRGGDVTCDRAGTPVGLSASIGAWPASTAPRQVAATLSRFGLLARGTTSTASVVARSDARARSLR